MSLALTSLLGVMLFGMDLERFFVLVVIIAAAVGLVLIAMRVFGVGIPPWVVQIFWIVIVAFVVIVAIHLVFSF